MLQPLLLQSPKLTGQRTPDSETILNRNSQKLGERLDKIQHKAVSAWVDYSLASVMALLETGSLLDCLR